MTKSKSISAGYLFNLVTAVFSSAELKEVKDFLDVGEYGLALQTFADIVKEEGKLIPPEANIAMEELATSMGIDNE